MNQPFLPEPEAAVAAPKKNARKALFLWVLLIVMFLAIWQVLTPAERTDAGRNTNRAQRTQVVAAEECPPPSSSFWNESVAMISPMVVVVLFGFLFLRAYRQNLAFAVSQEPGRLAMAHHRFAEASARFQETLPRFAKQPPYRLAVVINVAEAELRAGRFDGAIAACAEIERSRTLLFGSAVRIRIANLSALTYALRGDLVTAERWAGDARRRIAKNQEDRFGHAAHLCLAEAAIACRRGDPTGAVALLDARWNELRYALTADSMRVVEVIRAFAEAQGGIRASNTVAERLVRVEPVAPGELAYLGAEWPEMKAFLGAHGIAG
ncbi:MAG: hypothetical protein QOI41_6696 [Myxococcales bacterium]|jgi:hypothetical protein|nr:hypothetical protein [Myxococcales bacterium]